MAATLELKYFNSFWLKKLDSIVDVINTVSTLSEDVTDSATITLTTANPDISVGQLVSWIWILGGWFLLILGLRAAYKLGGLEKTIGIILLMTIISSWLAVLIVQGDNRYRIPFMPFSLFLQVCGYKALRKVNFLS